MIIEIENENENENENETPTTIGTKNELTVMGTDGGLDGWCLLRNSITENLSVVAGQGAGSTNHP